LAKTNGSVFQICSRIITDWIVDYFSRKSSTLKPTNTHDILDDASQVMITDRMPLILQDAGHSRTIVGYEITKSNEITLLTFDPSRVLNKHERAIALSLWSQHTSSIFSSSSNSDKSRQRPSSTVLSSTLSSPKRAQSAEDVIRIKHNEDEVILENPENTGLPLGAQIILSGKVEMSDKSLRQFLDRFRLEPRKLRKKEYQILYFPMTAPLTETEKKNRKIVTSTKFC